MSAEMRLGRTRWRRFAAVLVPALAAAAILVGVTGEGGVAASFALSGERFKISADRLVGKGFAQYGDVASTAEGRRPVLVSVIGRARITGLCQSALVRTPVGPVTFLVRAGDGERPVEAANLVIDLHQLSGDVTFGDIEIGRDAATLDAPRRSGRPSGRHRPAGGHRAHHRPAADRLRRQQPAPSGSTGCGSASSPATTSASDHA
ncbi:DUF6230 family protein [Nonomuraea ferruginea]